MLVKLNNYCVSVRENFTRSTASIDDKFDVSLDALDLQISLDQGHQKMFHSPLIKRLQIRCFTWCPALDQKKGIEWNIEFDQKINLIDCPALDQKINLIDCPALDQKKGIEWNIEFDQKINLIEFDQDNQINLKFDQIR